MKADENVRSIKMLEGETRDSRSAEPCVRRSVVQCRTIQCNTQDSKRSAAEIMEIDRTSDNNVATMNTCVLTILLRHTFMVSSVDEHAIRPEQFECQHNEEHLARVRASINEVAIEHILDRFGRDAIAPQNRE